MSIDKIIKDLNSFGGAKVTVLSDDESPCIVHEVMETGCLALDAILGGGLPVGRITEIYGDESTGKSLIAAYVAAMAQEAGHVVMYIDTESAVSINMMKQIGVNVDSIIYSVPDVIDGKDGVFQLMQNAIDVRNRKAPDKLLFIVWDSIAATSALAEMEADYGKATMGKHAQLISQGLRKIQPLISKERVCALFLNQTRQKIGVMFGDNTATFGGKAVAFYSSIRVELKRKGKIKADNELVGERIVATTVKNKVYMPWLSTLLPIYFGYGIDDAEASFEYLKDKGFITGSSGWYEMDIGGDKFRKSDWESLYEELYDEISNVVLEDIYDEDAE